MFGALLIQGLIIAGFVGASLSLVNNSANVAQDKGAQAVTLAGLADQNRGEVTRLGGTPIGPDPGTVLRGDPGPAGAEGPTGQPGSTGTPGRDGRDGRSATPKEISDAVAAYLKAHPPQAGAAGQNGRDGRDGVDGTSPACVVEVEECRGATGPQGPQGDPGEPGHPKPFAFSFTLPSGDTVLIDCRVDGDTLHCTQLPT